MCDHAHQMLSRAGSRGPVVPLSGEGLSGQGADVMIDDDQDLRILQSLAVSLRDRERGQTMAEYAVLLAVITVAIVATLIVLAGGITKTLSSVTGKL
jgi:Flp pilus assembly pilin Flp